MAAMEDALDLNAAPYDRQRPVICFDETPRQLIDDARPPQPMQPGQPAREDTEFHARQGERPVAKGEIPLHAQAWKLAEHG